jgi:hypothetical protein
MDWRTITVSAEVDIYLKDVAEEVLRMVDTDELIEELSERDVDIKLESNEYHMLRKLYYSPDELYRLLCDIAGCGYHESKDSLLNKIKDLI